MNLLAQTITIANFFLFGHLNLQNKQFKKLDKGNPFKGYGLLKLFKCLLLQFMENLSDREVEAFIQENNAAKFFCGFELKDKTPDHTVFCKTRSRIGTSLLSKIFTNL
ncbi:hypothetical protein COB11_04990 [Candidatus Aerophobetes bacterium]|uniref:Transposase InsH N-terminal domain-containing protein n=1 Tax=Aerophobetes bacterium TaxID=2030807 RepID=A0A2A4YH40_UNCAE|nr:MAG: hypothetical protein COB11_04990 [Candidatus Aerophobetes bacterium]